MFKIFFGGGQAVNSDQKFIYSNIAISLIKLDNIVFNLLSITKGGW